MYKTLTGVAIGAAVVVLGAGLLSTATDARKADENIRNWSETYPLTLQVKDIASGEDGILSDVEKVEMLRSLGLPAGLSEGENIYFERPGNDRDFQSKRLGKYTLVFASEAQGFGGTSGRTGRFVGEVHQDTLRDYVESNK